MRKSKLKGSRNSTEDHTASSKKILQADFEDVFTEEFYKGLDQSVHLKGAH